MVLLFLSRSIPAASPVCTVHEHTSPLRTPAAGSVAYYHAQRALTPPNARPNPPPSPPPLLLRLLLRAGVAVRAERPCLPEAAESSRSAAVPSSSPPPHPAATAAGPSHGPAATAAASVGRPSFSSLLRRRGLAGPSGATVRVRAWVRPLIGWKTPHAQGKVKPPRPVVVDRNADAGRIPGSLPD